MKISKLLVAASLAVASSAPLGAFAGEMGGKTVSVEQLPAATREAITREASGGKVEVKQVSDDGKLFRAEIKRPDNKKAEVYVDAEGKIVGRHLE